MKKLVAVLLLILFVNFSLGTTVYLRKGGTIEGKVISKDDENFTLKTAEGEKTIKWRSVKNKSIKEIHPELYGKLKARAIERKNNKNDNKKEVELKQLLKKDDENFSKIHLEIRTAEHFSPFAKFAFNGTVRGYKREGNGILKISLSKLDPIKDYTIKTEYSHYLKKDNKVNMPLNTPKRDENVIKKENISGKKTCQIEYTTLPYYFFKLKAKTGYYIKESHGRHLTKVKYGYKTDGWDVSVWLNDTLIYEKKKDKNPIYYNNILH